MNEKEIQPERKIPEMKPGVIMTYTGKIFNVFDPDPDLICIEDIAHALSNLCRFGGHTDDFYSVAEHSCRVSIEVPRALKLQALLHDASEAYIVDMPSPIKYHIPQYLEFENKLMSVIAEKFGFEYPLNDTVKRADKYLQQLEWERFIIKDRYWWSSYSNKDAELLFLNHYKIILKNNN
jgi:uncharacterized protein